MAEAGKLSLAALELSEAVRLDPENQEYVIFQASVLSRLGQKVPAAQALAAVRWDPDRTPLEAAWLWLLTETYLRLEKPEDALKVLDLLAARTPSDARIDLHRGRIFLARGEVERGIRSLQRSIAKEPGNPGAQFELGRIHYQRNEMPQAKKALLRAVQLQAQNSEYLHQLGLVCLALNEAKEAVEFLERAERAGTAFPQVYYALGNAHQRAGNRALAVEYRKKYQAVVQEQRLKEDRSREAGRLILQGEKQLDEGKREEARSLFEHAARVDSDNWDAHAYVVEMSLGSGQLQGLDGHLLKMEEIDPDSPVGNYLAAKYWYQRGELEKSRDCAEKVKAFRPGHAELRKLLGDIYTGLGEAEKARVEYEAAASLNSQRK
jgi:tetratricopeptide (TPR) repeat protein